MIIDTALTPDSGVKRAGDRKIRNDFEIISIGFVALSRSMAVISTRNCFGKCVSYKLLREEFTTDFLIRLQPNRPADP